MALNAVGKLEVVFKFRDASSAGLNKGRQNLKEFGDTAEKVGKRTKAAFLGAFPAMLTLSTLKSFGMQVARLIKPVTDLNESMAKLRAFGAAGDLTMEAFTEQAHEAAAAIGRNLGIETYKLVDALTELSKKGIVGGSAIAALVPSARLARVAGMEVAEAAEVAAVLTKVWGFEAEQLSYRMDQMALAARRSRMNFNELVDVMTRSASGVALVLDTGHFEDFLHIMMATRDVSQSAAITGTQMKVAYLSLMEGADELGGSLGVVITEGGRFRNLGDIIFDALSKSENSFAKVRETIVTVAGKRGMIPMVALFQQLDRIMKQYPRDLEGARKAFFSIRQELKMSSGELEELVEKMRENNFNFLIDRLKIGFQQLLETLGPSILKPLGDMAASLLGITNRVREFFEAVQRVREASGPLGTFLGLIGTAGRVLGVSLAGMVITMGLVRAATVRMKVVWDFATGSAIRHAKAEQAMTGATESATVANTQLANSNKVVGATSAGATQQLLKQAEAAGAVAGATGVASGVQTLKAGGTVAGGVGMMARFAPLLRGIGHVGLLLSFLLPLLLQLGVFSDDVESLDHLASRASREGQTMVDQLRTAGDITGASLLAAVTRFNKSFEDPPAILQQSTLDEMPIARLLERVVPEQRPAVEKSLVEGQQTMQTLFAQMAELGRTNQQVPEALKEAYMESARQFTLVFARYAGGDDNLTKAISEFQKETATLGPISESTDLATKVMEAMLRGSRVSYSELTTGDRAAGIIGPEDSGGGQRAPRAAKRTLLQEVAPTLPIMITQMPVMLSNALSTMALDAIRPIMSDSIMEVLDGVKNAADTVVMTSLADLGGLAWSGVTAAGSALLDLGTEIPKVKQIVDAARDVGPLQKTSTKVRTDADMLSAARATAEHTARMTQLLANGNNVSAESLAAATATAIAATQDRTLRPPE